MKADGTASTINSPQALQALTYMRGLITSGVAPAAITTFKEQQSESLFTSEQVAFLRNWTYAYADGNTQGSSQIAGNVGITNLPTFQGQSGPGYSVTGGWNMYVNPHTKNTPAAIAFIKWMTGTEAQTIVATQGGVIPTVAGVLADPQVQAANPAFPIAAKNKLNARPSFVSAYPKVSESIYTNINAALSGSASPQAALDAANQQLTAALNNTGL